MRERERPFTCFLPTINHNQFTDIIF
jgi:hypothetical protein